MAKTSPAPLRAGMVSHRPPIAEISRVCILSCSSPGKDEQRARADSVADHLNDRAFERNLISGEDAEQHESHVADTGVGNEALKVGLAEGKYGAIKNADHANGHHEGRKLM